MTNDTEFDLEQILTKKIKTKVLGGEKEQRLKKKVNNLTTTLERNKFKCVIDNAWVDGTTNCYYKRGMVTKSFKPYCVKSCPMRSRR